MYAPIHTTKRQSWRHKVRTSQIRILKCGRIIFVGWMSTGNCKIKYNYDMLNRHRAFEHTFVFDTSVCIILLSFFFFLCRMENKVGEMRCVSNLSFRCFNLFRLDTAIRSHLMIDSIRLQRKKKGKYFFFKEIQQTSNTANEERKLREFFSLTEQSKNSQSSVCNDKK